MNLAGKLFLFHNPNFNNKKVIKKIKLQHYDFLV
jgi:hypothetical protein